MLRKTTIALAAGMAAVMTGGIASGAITIQSIDYWFFAHTPPFGDTSDSGSIGLGDGTVHHISKTFAATYCSAALSIYFGDNYVCGSISSLGHFNYGDLINDNRYVRLNVDITFTTDSAVTCSILGSGWLPQLATGMIDGIDLLITNGVTVGPGTHSFSGIVSTGGEYQTPLEGFSKLGFGIPAPSTAINLLGVGLIASARRRRS